VHHARVYSGLENIELVAVSDLSLSAAEAVSCKYKCTAYKDYSEMLSKEKPDLVSVVVPTSLHAKIGKDALLHSNALVEKPIALSEAECIELINASSSSGNKLTIGHVERFNPVVEYLKDATKEKQFLSFSIMRLGPYTPVRRTTGVLLDMGIHDIDLVRHITKESPVSVSAFYKKVNIKDFEDQAHVFLEMPSCSASLVCNWISPVKIRHLYAVTTDSFIYLDFMSQEILIEEKTGSVDNKQTRVKMKYEEPLARELAAFARCVRDDTAPPVSGEDAFESVKVALLADKCARGDMP